MNARDECVTIYNRLLGGKHADYLTPNRIIAAMVTAFEAGAEQRQSQHDDALLAAAELVAGRDALLREAMKMLRKREWDNSDGNESWCGSCGSYSGISHEHDCIYAYLLARIDAAIGGEE